MVPVPSPPTDNFYKFVAICFVVLLVGAIGMAYFEMKAIAEAGLSEQRSVDEQTAKLEVWVIDADNVEAKSLRQEYATQRTAKLLEESVARKKAYASSLGRVASWWGYAVILCTMAAISGLALWVVRVQLIQDEIQRLEKRLLTAQVLRAEFDNRDIPKEVPGSR